MMVKHSAAAYALMMCVMLGTLLCAAEVVVVAGEGGEMEEVRAGGPTESTARSLAPCQGGVSCVLLQGPPAGWLAGWMHV